MTRKEQILNKAIDYSEIEENFLEYDDFGDTCDDKDFIEKAFIEGAKWADKTMLEKACEYLKSLVYPKFVGDTLERAFSDEDIERFKKVMEE